MNNRVAKVYLDPERVAQLLQMPKGTQILRIQGRFDPVAIEIVFTHPDLPEQPENTEAPSIPVKWTVTTATAITANFGDLSKVPTGWA